MYAVNLSSTLGSASPFFISESSADFYSNSAPFNADDSNDQLADKITTLAGQINAATYRFIKMIAEFDRRKAWVGPGVRSCAYWLAWKSGLLFNLKKYLLWRERRFGLLRRLWVYLKRMRRLRRVS